MKDMYKKIMFCSLLAVSVLPTTLMANSADTLSDNQQKTEAYNQAMAEYGQLMKEYEAKLEAYENAIEENKKIEEENKKLKEEYDKLYDQYLVDKEEYEKKLEEMEANTGNDGYLSQVISQNLQFNSNPQANVSISGGTPTDVVAEGGSIQARNGAHKPNVGRILSRNDKIDVTYTNLKDMSYGGKKIVKMVNTFTMDEKNYQDQIYVFSYQDPANGFMVQNLEGQSGRTAVKISTKFYDEEGNVITFEKDKPAVIAFSSLNNNTNPTINTKWIETIRDFNGDFVKITGSLIDQDNNGVIKANTYTNNNPDLPENIDSVDSPYFYLMSGAGVINNGDTISFVVDCYGIEKDGQPAGNDSAGDQWVAYNTKIPVPVLPEQPVPPVEPQYKELNPLAFEKPEPPVKPEAPILAEVEEPVQEETPEVKQKVKTGSNTTVPSLLTIVTTSMLSLALIQVIKRLK